eukprot:s2_g74.t1
MAMEDAAVQEPNYANLNPHDFRPSKSIPVHFKTGDGRLVDHILQFWDIVMECEINELILPLKAGRFDSRMPSLMNCIEQWCAWDEVLTEEFSCTSSLPIGPYWRRRSVTTSSTWSLTRLERTSWVALSCTSILSL